MRRVFIAAVLVVLAGQAAAEEVKLDYEFTVAGTFGDFFPAPMTVSGAIVFDTSAPDVAPQAGIGLYATSSSAVTINGVEHPVVSLPLFSALIVYDDVSLGPHVVDLWSADVNFQTPFIVNGALIHGVSVQFQGPTTTFSADQFFLPDTAQLRGAYGLVTFDSPLDGHLSVGISGELSKATLTPVPIPGGALLLLSGLFGLATHARISRMARGALCHSRG